MNKKLFS